MSDPTRTSKRLQRQAADGNLDLEDLAFSVQAAREDGHIDEAERQVLSAGLLAYGEQMEPMARAWLEAVLAGRDIFPPFRVLLAPHPRGAPPDLYYARSDVVALQESLDALGFPTDNDGYYGAGTAAQVRAFQLSSALPQTGVVDPGTLLALNRRLEAGGLPLLDLHPRAHIRPDFVVALRGGANIEDIRKIQEALSRLAGRLGHHPLDCPVSGNFDARTEAAVKAFQAEAFLPATGIVDASMVTVLEAALSAAGLPGLDLDEPEGGGGFLGQISLHFFPGDGALKVVVVQDGRILDVYGMVGGPGQASADPRNPQVGFSPSPEGAYEVIGIAPHASGAWSWSYVPYGSALREAGGEVQYQDADGNWHVATGPKGVFANRNPPPLDHADYLDPQGRLPPVWNLNDFGHLRAMLRSVATGRIQSHMIHSSPWNESTAAYFADTRALLDPARALQSIRRSHGCEHIHPRDLDDMVARGYLAPGTRFVIHGYDEAFPTSDPLE